MNLATDDNLVQEVKGLGDYKTKRAVVNGALRDYVTRRNEKKSLRYLGILIGTLKIITKLHEDKNPHESTMLAQSQMPIKTLSNSHRLRKSYTMYNEQITQDQIFVYVICTSFFSNHIN